MNKFQISNVKFQISNVVIRVWQRIYWKLEIGNWKLDIPPRGFSLVELLIIVTIIGILATFSIANFLGAQARGRDAQRKANLRQLQSAFELYRADNASYPLAPLPACGQPLAVSGSVYIQKIPCDPKNTGQFVFRYTSNGSTYTLTACLENINDSQKDTTNNTSYCSGGTTNWSYTLTNP